MKRMIRTASLLALLAAIALSVAGCSTLAEVSRRQAQTEKVEVEPTIEDPSTIP